MGSTNLRGSMITKYHVQVLHVTLHTFLFIIVNFLSHNTVDVIFTELSHCIYNSS